MTDRNPVEAASYPPPLPVELYAAPAGRPQLGSLLLRDGAVTLEQLEYSLAEKEANGGRLGEILLRHGYSSGDQIARALAEQHDLEYLQLGSIKIDPSATMLLPEAAARRLGALPVSFAANDVVLIAVSDPTDVIASDDLRLAIGHQIRFGVVATDDLTKMIDRCYRPNIMPAHEEPTHASPAGARIEDVREGSATSAPAIRLANEIIAKAIEDGASDIHFEPQADEMVVRARIDGVMRRVAEVPKSLQPAMTSRLKIMGELDIADRRIPQDGRVSIRYGGSPMDLRIAVLPTTHGEQVVLRILHQASGRRTLPDLGMSEAAEAAFTRAVKQPYGAVIACGPTGSGKTTTLYSALEFLNEESRTLTTIEDPVEYQLSGVNQIEVNARAGLTFASGLRTILRSDPDVLLVGEIRDEETARIAIQAAMTGHLVLTTLHTHNAASSIARLRDMGVEQSLLAASVNCIVAQRLARRLCRDCREPYTPTEADLAGDAVEGLGLENETLYRPRGCPQCSSTGYNGRVALYEVMPVVGKIRRLIEASTEEIFAAAVEAGMTTLREDGIRLCRAGVSSLEEIRRVTGDRLM
jgi:type IV pilus assembly protein PilB